MAADPRRPRAPKKSLTEHVEAQRQFLDTNLRPALDAAVAGTGHVFFADAAHFVFGTYLCCLWSILRVRVRAASGRQRLNVLSAWNAVTRQLLVVTDTTVVNTDTMCEVLRAIAAQRSAGQVTVVLDNARYQRNKAVQALAAELGLWLLFLPRYSPNLNVIERLWGFAKRTAVYGKYHADFASFRAAIEATLAGIPTTHADALESLMTLKFQTFEDISLLAAYGIGTVPSPQWRVLQWQYPPRPTGPPRPRSTGGPRSVRPSTSRLMLPTESGQGESGVDSN